MTGIGCYGKSPHIVRTLVRALRRFGLSPGDVLDVAWRPDACLAGCRRLPSDGPRNLPAGDAVAKLSRHDKVAGFFLSAADGKPRLHVRMRSN